MKKFTREGHNDTKFFVAGEVEQTPAFGKKTLFVVGLQDTNTIERLAREHKTLHIFLGANRSFDSLELKNGMYMIENTLALDWEKQIQSLIERGFVVTLDYPAHKHVDVLSILNKTIWQSRNFIPVLSVAVPNVNTSNINLTIKIDDISFGATNPGVWCMNHHEITNSNRFTGWEEYNNDVIISDEATNSVQTTPVFISRISVPESNTPTNSVTGQSLTLDQLSAYYGTTENNQDLGLDRPSNVNITTDETGRKTFYVDVGDTPADQVGQLLADVKEKFSEVKNNQDLGLDPDAPSLLKPEITEKPVKAAIATPVPIVNVPDLVEELYAELPEQSSLKAIPKKAKSSKTKNV